MHDNSTLSTFIRPGFKQLPLLDRVGIVTLMVVLVAFGVVVEIRSSFLKRHMTDLGVYLRAGWAVRAGEDIYDITDDNEWHYQYPPLFAITMTPFADPPAGADRTGMLPFAVTAAFWYVFNVFCLAFSVHQLANILEIRANRQSPSAIIDKQRWWRFRIIPVLACLVPTGQTLMRGQVSLLLLAFFCATVAAMYRGRSVRAGLWLSAAICLKVIPAFLLVFPFWRRDWRCLAGCAIGLLMGLMVIPAAVFGVPRTVEYYREYDFKVLRPGMGQDEDKSRARELIQTTATDSQSLIAMIHNTAHLDRGQRPPDASPEVRRLHWLLGAGLTLITLLAAGWPAARSPAAAVLLMGALVFNMLLLSPVCHLHYYCLLIPLVIGLLAVAWEHEDSPALRVPLLVLLSLNAMAGLLPVIPGLEILRDIGIASYGALALWGVSCVVMWRENRRSQIGAATTAPAIAA